MIEITKMSTPPIASIIVVTYNAMPYLDSCLAAVMQEAKELHEIIVIDNASTDETCRYIQEKFPAVTLVCNQGNPGFAVACNQGAKLANGRYFVFLNQDTIVYPNWLENLLLPLKSDSTVALSTSKLLLMSQPEQINACGQDVHFTGLSFTRGILKSADLYCEPSVICAVHGASFAAKRAIWSQLNGFDETFFMYYEETDLSWRAQLAGYRCVYVPKSITLHDYKLAQSSANAFYYSKRNRYIMLVKNWHWRTLCLFLPGLILAEGLDWGHAILIGQKGLSAKLRSYRWLATNFQQILGLRTQTQAGRTVGDHALLETCTGDLHPVEFQGGVVGALITRFSELVFQYNYRLARRICTSLNL